MTPTTLKELFETPVDEIDFDGSVYALNHKLNLAPWLPPVVEVWVGERPDYTSEEDWNVVADLLKELHAEHVRRKA